MPFPPPVLDGSHVRLEPIEERHRAELRPAAQHPEIWTVTTSAFGALFDPYIDLALKRSAAGAERAFAVRHKALDRCVGMTRFLAIEPAHKRLEIGATWYEPAVWASPVNPECKLLLMAHAFETLGWHRVEFKTDARNARSRAAIAKLGALEEGVFRRHMIMPDGHVRDSVWFSVIDADWPKVKAGLAARAAR